MPETPNQNLPDVPTPAPVTIPAQPTFPPFTPPMPAVTAEEYLQLQEQLFFQQLGQMRPTISAISELTSEYMPGMAQARLELEQEFGPQFTEMMMGKLNIAAPEFMPTYTSLGQKVQEGLNLGYELGPDLEREVEQGIRAAQTARGNWLGPAPTAQEAMGKGTSALNMYNMRLGQAQNFINSKQPTDLWGALGMTNAAQPLNAVFPSTGYPNAALAGQAFSTIGASGASYNAAAASGYGSMVGAQASVYGSYVSGLVGAGQVNNQALFDTYNANFDQFLFNQAGAAGMFQQPAAPAGGGGGAGIAGAAIGGVATAASAAISAICWLAREVIPDKWKEWRRWLFTEAPDELRRAYIFNARRWVKNLTEAEKRRLAPLMKGCIV